MDIGFQTPGLKDQKQADWLEIKTYTGKEVIIKRTLSSMPIYSMSTMLFPKVINRRQAVQGFLVGVHRSKTFVPQNCNNLCQSQWRTKF